MWHLKFLDGSGGETSTPVISITEDTDALDVAALPSALRGLAENDRPACVGSLGGRAS
ncbi:hypothetical protein G1H11_16040 [Phytoactinopolyspora alkaliphila]|uniref:Uncharacterized protein n=1 Tax=Phytoactinopolyspora alkaliphila TaxID=1783498 RepID=A0A6N9YPS2_9ACTN|nr:hypothetical protein [Phytoactinopolyspora alkaliphila]NED96819.1 hypothetical protein [Phytoactinopolyspora alkaliphila]